MEKRLLVIFHVYYAEHIPYFIGKMKNITIADWDLLVTGSNLSDSAKRQITSFKPDASFLQTVNRGYDIGPFIQAVKTIDLDRYSVVLKLHTKNIDEKSVMKLNGDNLNGHRWRDTMVDALLGTPRAFDNMLNAFCDEKVGIVYSMSVNVLSRGASAEDSYQLENEMERLGIRRPDSMFFCGGTIFAARAQALRYIQDDRISADIFELSAASHLQGTMAHSYERILTLAIRSQGYTAFLVPKNLPLLVYYRMKHSIQPLLEWIFSIDFLGGNGDKYMTLLGLKFKLRGS